MKNSIYNSNKRVPLPFFYSDTNPVRGYVLRHSFDKTHALVVTVELIWLLLLNMLFFQLCSNAEQISVRLARFRRSYVKLPAVILTSKTSYTAFLLDLHCDVQSGHVPFFCSCLFPMIMYLRNLFLLNTLLTRMLLAPRWVSRQKDEKM